MATNVGRKGKKNVNVDPLQNSVANFLKTPKDFRKDEIRTNNTIGFTPFDPKQKKQAVQLNSEFMKIANSNPDNPIVKVLEFAKETAKTTDPELVRWALMSFIIHHPAARSSNLRIPSLVNRSPETSVPKKKDVLVLAPGPIVSDPGKNEPATEDPNLDIETLLSWWREDPNFNEHHEHWHAVYQGVPDPNNPDVIIKKDRHGELFVNMHRQMLARYDAERQALNLPLVTPLDDYRSPITEGYKPNDQLIDADDNNSTFGTRESNSVLGDVGDITISNMEKNRQDLETAIDNGQFVDGTDVTVGLLGSVIEPSEIENKENLVDYYGGGLHSNGHIAIAYISNPSHANEAGVDPGVMYNPRVAARDPVFWRWHRHIDDLVYKWESKLEPNDFSDPPPVNIREGDIILAFKDKLPINNGETQDEEATDFGEKTFGGDNFDNDVSDNEFVTHELETKMKSRLWTYLEDSGATQEIEYLYPREYYYYFRVENTSSSSLDATFRVFLVPEELANSRRHWIELDKFKQTLSPNSKTVVCRDCDMSSVVRQPPQKTDDELDDTATKPGIKETSDEQFCDCGWPFHLLLPRGRKGGMKFKLLLFITDWSQDEVPRLSRCGSISFCGAEGPAEKYPDSKPMGYPFDRPFKNDSYEETFAGLNNATIRDVNINWVDNFPEIVVET